jgi:hypothetical protein
MKESFSDEIINPYFLRKVHILENGRIGFRTRAIRYLWRNGILYLCHLCQMKEQYLRTLPGMGHVLLKEIEDGLLEIELKLGMNTNFPIDPVGNVRKRHLIIKTILNDMRFIGNIIMNKTFEGTRQELAGKINDYAIKYKLWLEGLPIEVLIEDLRMMEDDNRGFSKVLLRFCEGMKDYGSWNWNGTYEGFCRMEEFKETQSIEKNINNC